MYSYFLFNSITAVIGSRTQSHGRAPSRHRLMWCSTPYTSNFPTKSTRSSGRGNLAHAEGCIFFCLQPRRVKKTHVSRRQPWARGSRSPRATATGTRQICRGKWTSCSRETSPRPAPTERGRLLAVPRRWWCWQVGRHFPGSFNLPVSGELHGSCDDAWLLSGATTLSMGRCVWLEFLVHSHGQRYRKRHL